MQPWHGDQSGCSVSTAALTRQRRPGNLGGSDSTISDPATDTTGTRDLTCPTSRALLARSLTDHPRPAMAGMGAQGTGAVVLWRRRPHAVRGLRRSVCSRPGRALFGKSLSMQGRMARRVLEPDFEASFGVRGWGLRWSTGPSGRREPHRPEQGPQSDESHPSIRGVSSRTGIDKASEVGRHWVGGSVGSWLKMGGRCRGSLAGKRAEVEVGHARSPRDL